MVQGPSTVLVEVAARNGQPAAKTVPAEGPILRSFPQPEAGRTAAGETEESPSSSLVDGRYSAPSALLTPGTGSLAAVLPPEAAPPGVA